MTPPQDFHESRHDGQNRVEPQSLDVLSPITSQKAYTGPERRSSMRVWQDKVDRRLQEGDERMQTMADGLAENTSATQAIKADTEELVDLLHSVKGALKVLDMLARLARPLGFLAAAGASFYAFYVALKGGGGKA
jgi:hypothetical protein